MWVFDGYGKRPWRTVVEYRKIMDLIWSFLITRCGVYEVDELTMVRQSTVAAGSVSSCCVLGRCRICQHLPFPQTFRVVVGSATSTTDVKDNC